MSGAWRAYLPVAVVGLLLAAVPLFAGHSRYLMGLAVGTLVFACYGVGLNVIFGSTGQLFLCLGALAGMAGYGSAILSDRGGWPLILALPVAAAAAAGLGGLFSWIAVRRGLDVIFVGIVTLAFSLGFGNLLLGQRDLTGGETGIVVEAGAGTFLRGEVPPYYLFLLVLVVFLMGYRGIQRSSMGWAFRALRDDPEAAELAGIDVARYRIRAGLIGSAMVGLAGGLYAHVEGFVSPTTYAFQHVDVRTLVVLAFGGIGSLLGPIVGAVAFGVLDELLRGLGQLRTAVYGVALIALFLGFRSGVVPVVSGMARKLHRRRPAPARPARRPAMHRRRRPG